MQVARQKASAKGSRRSSPSGNQTSVDVGHRPSARAVEDDRNGDRALPAAIKCGAPRVTQPVNHIERQITWLSIAQAAARAGNSTRTVKRWIKAGYLEFNRLPSPKGRGPLRVRLGDVESIIARGVLS